MNLLRDNFDYIVFLVGAFLLLLIVTPQDQEQEDAPPAPLSCSCEGREPDCEMIRFHIRDLYYADCAIGAEGSFCCSVAPGQKK